MNMLKEREVTIRPANLSDSKAIIVVLQESGFFTDIHKKALTDPEARISKHLSRCETDESHLILVAENQNGEVLGYIGVHWLQYIMASDTRGYVSELFVRQSARGRGIGRRLLEVIKEKAIERGCSRIMVLNVPNRISYSRRFFLKLGWKERQEITNCILPIDSKT
jgi:GNAT superfamily N-acetyltransferase